MYCVLSVNDRDLDYDTMCRLDEDLMRLFKGRVERVKPSKEYTDFPAE